MIKTPISLIYTVFSLSLLFSTFLIFINFVPHSFYSTISSFLSFTRATLHLQFWTFSFIFIPFPKFRKVCFSILPSCLIFGTGSTQQSINFWCYLSEYIYFNMNVVRSGITLYTKFLHVLHSPISTVPFPCYQVVPCSIVPKEGKKNELMSLPWTSLF